MEAKIKGPPRVERDAHWAEVLASFDTLDEAVAYVRRQRSDGRYIVRDIRTIAWPESEPLGLSTLGSVVAVATVNAVQNIVATPSGLRY